MNSGIAQSGLRVYIPGYLLQKIAYSLVTMALFLCGFYECSKPLKVLIHGLPAEAEVVGIIMSKGGETNQIYWRESSANVIFDEKDRSHTYKAIFRFQTINGNWIDVISQQGMQRKPAYPFYDEDGLPTSVRIYYLPHCPSVIAIPWQLSTWSFPAILMFIGFMMSIAALIVLWNARKPIRLDSPE